MAYMATTFEKLNLKDQQEIVVLNAPQSFEPELSQLKTKTVHRQITAAPHLDFFLAFVTRKAEVDALAQQVARRAKGDATVWFAYPKGTSKKYQCDFNRDNGWDKMNALGFQVVRAVAVDQDWAALRLRRSEFIKARA